MEKAIIMEVTKFSAVDMWTSNEHMEIVAVGLLEHVNVCILITRVCRVL